MTFKNSLLLSLLICITFFETGFAGSNSQSFVFPENKVFFHRMNSSEKINQQNLINVSGAEMDIYFIENKFMVSHDNGDLESAPFLEDHLKNYFSQKPEGYLWLDFKNLSWSNESLARKELIRILSANKAIHRSLVETKKSWATLRLCKAPIFCSLWVQPHGNPIKSLLYSASAKLALTVNTFASVSANEEHLPILQKNHPTHSKLVFGVNSKERMEELKSKKDIKIILFNSQK